MVPGVPRNNLASSKVAGGEGLDMETGTVWYVREIFFYFNDFY